MLKKRIVGAIIGIIIGGIISVGIVLMLGPVLPPLFLSLYGDLDNLSPYELEQAYIWAGLISAAVVVVPGIIIGAVIGWRRSVIEKKQPTRKVGPTT